MSIIRENKISELSRDELEKKVFDLKNLIEIAISLSSNLEFDSLVESILYICIGQMIVDRIAIFLQTSLDNDNLHIYMQRGYNLDDTLEISEKSLLVKTLNKKREILGREQTEKLMADDRLVSDIYKEIKPEIVIPLQSKSSLNGLIFISNKLIDSEYSEEDLDFLDNMSKFASIAVENSRLYRMATLDRMTGLYVHHYFQERLSEEIKRSERNSNPLTILMADLDHFKNINDNYGHQQGDQILKEVADIIQQNIRGFDIASRYGGEEFAVILTETDINTAYRIAERLRKKIEKKIFKTESGNISITISIGIAQFDPVLHKSKRALIEKADTALYRAKSEGRNMVIIDEEGEGALKQR